MPTVEELGQRVKAKYPEYGTLSDIDVGRKVKSKFPGDYDQFDDISDSPIGNPVSSGRAQLPSGLTKDPLSEVPTMGGEALRNLPRSVGKFALDAVMSSPGMAGISNIINPPADPIGALKEGAKSLYQTFRHPMESFARDPVGTAAAAYPAGEGALKIGAPMARGAFRGAREVLPTAMKTGQAGIYAGGALGRLFGGDWTMGAALGGLAGGGVPLAKGAVKGTMKELGKGIDMTPTPIKAFDKIKNKFSPKESRSPIWKDIPKSESKSLDLSSKKPELETIRTKETKSRQEPQWKSLPKVENKEEFTIKTESPRPREFREIKRETEIPKKTTKLEVDIPEDLHTDYHDMAKVEGPRQAKNSQVKDQTIAEKIFEAEDIKDVHDFLARPSEFRKQFIKESTNKKHISDSYGSETRRKQLINRFNSLGK